MAIPSHGVFAVSDFRDGSNRPYWAPANSASASIADVGGMAFRDLLHPLAHLERRHFPAPLFAAMNEW
jgi:hypothetical protein